MSLTFDQQVARVSTVACVTQVRATLNRHGPDHLSEWWLASPLLGRDG